MSRMKKRGQLTIFIIIGILILLIFEVMFYMSSYKLKVDSNTTAMPRRTGDASGVVSGECEVGPRPPDGQIPSIVNGIRLTGGRETLTPYQSGYTAFPWLLFHTNSYVELEGTGYLYIRWEYEGNHRPEGEGEQQPPEISGDITYVGDFPPDPQSVGHHWPGSNSRNLLFCIAGRARIVDLEATGGKPGWYNMMINTASQGCINEVSTPNPTEYTGPYNAAVADRCRALAQN